MAQTRVQPLLRSIGSVTADPEELELVSCARAGDRGAFECLVKRTERAVTSVVSRVLDSPDDIADVIQEVYLAAYRDLPSFRGDSRFSTWIYRIALHVALKQRKRSIRTAHLSLDDHEGASADLPDQSADAPEAAALKNLQSDQIRAAVGKLPEKHRVVVILHHYQHLPCDEIARILNCPVGTVWSRLHHAYQNLRRSLRWLEE